MCSKPERWRSGLSSQADRGRRRRAGHPRGVEWDAYFSPAIAKRLREQSRQEPSEAQQTRPNVELTQREAEVLQLIAEGYANKQIAAELN